MSELQRHRLVYTILQPVIKIFMQLKFGYEYDDLSKEEGPYLLLANHNLELDPAAVGVASRKQLYFVASEHILRKGLGTWFLMFFFKPIIHMKGKQGVQTVVQMLKTLKAGHNVCIFPEGNRSFNGLTGQMQPSIAKVARRSGAKLITYRIEGGYLSQPRWSKTLRKGKLRGRLIGRYLPEDLKGLTDAQVYELICKDLYEDAYATQERERIPFKGKDLALGLESTIFTCPSCKKVGTLHSQGSRFFCDCGFEACYDEYGMLTDRDGEQYTVTDLDGMQKEVLKERLENANPQEVLFKDEVTVSRIGADHSFQGSEVTELAAYSDRLSFSGKELPYEKIKGMAIYSRNSMILHLENEDGHIEMKAGDSFSALKYLYLYEFVTKEKEY